LGHGNRPDRDVEEFEAKKDKGIKAQVVAQPVGAMVNGAGVIQEGIDAVLGLGFRLCGPTVAIRESE
jgi:hypothetical protein